MRFLNQFFARQRARRRVCDSDLRLSTVHESHYREQFCVWRELNAAEVAQGQFESASQRVCKMIRFDEELVEEMRMLSALDSGEMPPREHFAHHRNLELADLQLLLEAAGALSNEDMARQALDAIQRLPQRRPAQ